mmetsp:Transcript_34974/g.65270  ORF Transcript_34974/g.65270 Transcript_34974/m.65270 type:complete len:541 (-) Transcript_34974:62-1684(-)
MSKKEKKEKKSSSKKDHKRKDKKSKKHKKLKSYKRSDDHNSRNRSRNVNTPIDAVSQMLSVGMVLFPQLQSDLSGILMALDSGKQFQLLDNGDKFNSFLLQLFKHLPLKEKNSIWTKVDYSTKIRRYVMNSLLQNQVIEQPSTLSASKSLAIRAAKVIAPLMTKYPTLWNDISPLLYNFSSGEAVDVSGIEIYAIREGLCTFFQAIGAESETDDSMTFVLPMKSLSGQPSGKDVRKAVLYFADLFDFTKRSISELSIDVDLEIVPPEQSDSDNDDVSISSDSSASGDGDDSESVDVEYQGVARKGPSMPTKAELALAAKLSAKNTAMYLEGSDDDEDVGPAVVSRPPGGSSRGSLQSADNAPLGGATSSNRGQDGSGGGDGVALETLSGKESSGKLEREEWMLTPGERMPFGGDSTDPTMPSNRKFERGKLAKKSAEAIAAQREAEYEQYMNSEEGKEAEAVLEEYRKKRGPSLMQKHMDDVASKRAKTGSTALSEMRQKGFDRERDMSSHRQMGSDQARKLIEEAKGLDSRFSRSYARK